MSIWIGEIGGTSSRWGQCSNGQSELFPGPFPGFNPLTGDPLPMQERLRSMAAARGGEAPGEVIAYGAGCGAQARARRMHDALAEVWPESKITVETDLLGAARGLYGRDQGLVLILGTGMNVGHYDGEYLHTPMPSLGFILGDEGSGADIGKHLLRDALYGLVPERIRAQLFPQGMDLPGVLEGIYRGRAPQAYVASYTAVLADHLDNTYVHDLVVSRFFALARLLGQYFDARERGMARATGSVAWGFRELLATALASKGIGLEEVQRDPINGLLRYHARPRP